MSDRWIMDVLSDLKSFAQTNDLPALAEQLDDALTVAALELANRPACSRACPKQGAELSPNSRTH